MTPSTNKPCQNSLRDLTFQKIFLFVILFLGELSASCKVSEIWKQIFCLPSIRVELL